MDAPGGASDILPGGGPALHACASGCCVPWRRAWSAEPTQNKREVDNGGGAAGKHKEHEPVRQAWPHEQAISTYGNPGGGMP
jgi:hypothetical protein